MRFLVDAQLPKCFANWLNEAGHDALHTLDLPRKNLTTDLELISRAKRDDRVVVSRKAESGKEAVIHK
jgi:predicted nuclease of predicted toxin-antitoxin system